MSDQGEYVEELRQQVADLIGDPEPDSTIFETLEELESEGVTVYWSIVQQNILPAARWADFT